MAFALAGAPTWAQNAGQPPAQQTPPPAQKELMAEDVYKNIQVLRGIPENQFLSTMGFFSASVILAETAS
jgi:hypothetical protein